MIHPLNEVTRARSISHAESTVSTRLQRVLQLLAQAQSALAIFFSCTIMGLPVELLRTPFSQSPTARGVVFDGIAVTASSISIGLLTTSSAARLFGYSWYVACIMGPVVGAGFFILDRRSLLQRYEAGIMTTSQKIQFSINRAIVLFIVFSLSLFNALNVNHETIDAQILQKQIEYANQISSTPRYKPRLEAARSAVEIAIKAEERRLELTADLANKTRDLEVAKRNVTDECEGNFVDGKQKIKSCGPRARGFQSQVDMLSNQISAMKNEETVVAGATSNKTAASQHLASIELEISEEAKRKTSGLAMRLSSFFQLLTTDWAVILSVLPFMIIATICDMLLIVAFARPVDSLLAKVYVMQSEIANAEIDVLRVTHRTRLSNSLPPLHVRSTQQPSHRVPHAVGSADRG